jgi:hypothetical protein
MRGKTGKGIAAPAGQMNVFKALHVSHALRLYHEEFRYWLQAFDV